MQELRITDDLDTLLNVLPPTIAEAIRRIGRFNDLIEVVMDLGRLPESRYVSAEANGDAGSSTAREETRVLRETEVTQEDLNYVLERIGEFDDDNRAGIARTLHRISGIRNRRGAVVGLTCRVGRAVYGTLKIIEDIIESGKSILLLGKPGVGKTTMLREAARVLAETKRVVIVDTSNEIGGDGDIPHPAVGRARRMQVSTPSMQHEVMIEAVENHNPQVIVIDEIGRQQEAEAARTIAERGVQLIGTAHGQTIENLMVNPTLNDLIGGIESVTLSDEEARRRGTQKTVLERRAPPTFDVLIEIRDRHRLLVHHDVSEAVDALLRNRMPVAELRYWDEEGRMRSERVRLSQEDGRVRETEMSDRRDRRPRRNGYGAYDAGEDLPVLRTDRTGESVIVRPGEPEEREDQTAPTEKLETQPSEAKAMRLYAFGVSKHRLKQAARQLGVPAVFVDSLDDADVLITAKSYYRQRPRTIVEAEQDNVPIYVLRSNSVSQMESCLADLFGLTDGERIPYESAIEEAEEAIRRVLAGERVVDLSPQNAFVRRQQHQLARASNLVSHSYGKEPMRRVRIFRE
ncbi:MAG: AAA family ATPase [Chloroflexi bacterium]|jgi:stage III sporulation protein SpoIIIAA|uniref:AAA family ATPase n=1 Tax=Candidatus Thermofonsia Clade 3 bacterium TaxID=2364212 RepID=A0A2M8QCK8_9CHLR|nr:R3H domain-containing nucleic acid-binding protein [Candidatus Roseilinea sp. NK_OTU-006]PJF47543.1 MAG: AAA family ATPase [Candidatus Thermofonsia Clade 3 bacterium]RMG62056.1 MAG: AAA family ATPase [Chloroflexota bacterium]